MGPPRTLAPAGASLRRTSLLAAFGLLATLLVAYPAIAGHGDVSLGGSNFEIDSDANLITDHASPSTDWADVDENRQMDKDSGSSTDDSFGQGSDEQTPVPSVRTGGIPPSKSDLKSFGVYEEPGSPGFLHMFWTRVQDPSGTTNMDFEFNQAKCIEGGDQSGCSSNGVTPDRLPGDVLVTYNLSSGGSNISLWLHRWITSGTCEDSQEGGSGGGAATADGCWDVGVELTSSGDATGSVNTSAIAAADSDGLGALDPRTFGEASIDLEAIFGADACLAFGGAYLKSRSSDTFTSALKDFIAPLDVNISNCGSITIEKVTDPTGRPESFGFTTTGLTPSSFSLKDGESETFSNVLAGSYTVTESDPSPAEFVSVTCDSGSWSVSGRTVTINLSADDDITCTYTNQLKGSILVHKVDTSDGNALLDGAAFTITPGDIAMTESSTGVFCTDDLAFATYTVTESTVPTGYNGADPQDFAINSTKTCAEKIADGDAADLTFTNSPAPGRINIAKTDDDGGALNGAVFTLYTSNGDAVLDGDDTVVGTCTTGVSNFGDTNTPAAGSCSFIGVNTSAGGTEYWVDETTVPDGYSKAAGLPTTVTLGPGDTKNLPDSGAFENPQTHKVIVIVCHEGTDELADGTYDDSDAGTASKDTVSSPPTGVTQADLCSLDGFGDKAHGSENYSVTVSNHSSTP